MKKDVEKFFQSSDSGPPPVKDRFPRIVLVIILAEFCERFSFSGMRAFLTLYLRSKLGYTDDEATETYHIFSTFVYIFPIFGGILADSYFGKFKTILYMMFVYAAGNALVAITAIPQIGLPPRLCTLVGLFMITIGTGGIKPCVSAFGGDQIKSKNKHHIALYFSLFYFTLCIGSLIAKTVSPILRSEIHCFGDKDCYSIAFGAPGLVVLASIVIFVSAKNRYVMKNPEGNIVLDVIKCVSLGIKNALVGRSATEEGFHWLDSTRHQYDQRFIRDVKSTLSILTLFTVLPVFWALLDQMGSRWTLQATRMDGNFGIATVKPDQMQVLAPIFILIMIPTAQKYIYPFLEKRNLLRNPLHKLTLGGFLAGVAFIASAGLEIYLKTTSPQLPQPRFSQLRIFNGNPCSISLDVEVINLENTKYDISPLKYFSRMNFEVNGTRNVTLMPKGECFYAANNSFLLEEDRAVTLFLDGVEIHRYIDRVDKSKSGFPIVRFLVSNRVNTTVTLYNEIRKEAEILATKGVSSQTEVFDSIYSLGIGNETIRKGIDLKSGGVYVIMVGYFGNEYKSEVNVITEPNSITMALLLPQFFIISMAEVLFAVTGNEFAFREAPQSMKAVLTAVWLLTEAAGNVIIIVITRLFAGYKQVLFAVTGNEFAFREAPESMKAILTAVWLLTEAAGNVIIIVNTRLFAGYKQEIQSFIYTGLMFVAMVVFHYLARGYQFYETNQADEDGGNQRKIHYKEDYVHVKQAEDCLDH